VNEEESQRIRQYLKVIRRAASLIEDCLDGRDLPERTEEPIIATSNEAEESPDVLEDSQTDRESRVNELLESEDWPEAVAPYSITNETSRQDQIDRANAVLDMMLDRSVKGCNFLDFGCGEGWIAHQALERGAETSTGFDVKADPNWEELSEVNFTDDLKDVKRNHYHAVILYDVLDHCEDPVKAMEDVHKAVRDDGFVYVRCHPWTASHATHIYRKLNKAYTHLFLTWEEIKNKINEPPMYTRMELDPITAYHWWFKDFKIIKERIIREPVPEFFLQQEMKDIMMQTMGLSLEEVEPFCERMSMKFVDYLLAPK
jgi:SAM-dependent methyltransferase